MRKSCVYNTVYNVYAQRMTVDDSAAPSYRRPLADIVQQVPRQFIDDPRLRPMPPFEGCTLVAEWLEGAESADLGQFSEEVWPMLVMVHQVCTGSFGQPEVQRLFVFRMMART